MENKKIEMSLTELYQQRTRLGERIDWLNHAIGLYEAQLKGNSQTQDLLEPHFLNAGINNNELEVKKGGEEAVKKSEYKEILNIFKLAGRPLKKIEIKNYLENNLGLQPAHITGLLHDLKNKKIVACIKINNARKLSYWVMNEWVDWNVLELKREYKKFGVTQNYAIKNIDFF